MNIQQRTSLPSIGRIPPAAFLGCAGIVLIGAVFLTGLGIGFGVGRVSAAGAPWNKSASASATIRCDEQPEGIASGRLYPEFGLFWEAMDLLYEEYYGEFPSSEDTTYQAIRGVIAMLQDPNTSLLTPEEADYYRTNIEGAFEGIGARVGWDEEADTLIITEAFENQPAWRAGLRRNDLILAVDGQSLEGVGVDEAVRRIRGPKGSVVVLTVQHPNGLAPEDVEVVRDSIDIPTISVDALGEAGDIAYVRLNTFNENAGRLVRESVRDAVERDAGAVILDLRGNTGGLLREAVKVVSIFLEDEVVLFERFSDGAEEVYRTEGRAVAPDIPLVVLVDSGSASASEIVAGALQDHGRAQIVGSTTFGKGSVQLPHTLSNGGILRMTIARWFTPDDRSIEGVGLDPDVVIESPATPTGDAGDLQLDVAVGIVSEMMEKE